MGDIQFIDGQILFVEGVIAFHEDCCCAPPDPCEVCTEDIIEGHTIDVTLAGHAQGDEYDCEHCDEINGTHSLVHVGGCLWSLEIFNYAADCWITVTLRVTSEADVFPAPNFIRYQVEVISYDADTGTPFTTVIYRLDEAADGGGQTDCEDMRAIPLLANDSYYCTGAGSTCSIN